MAIPTDSLSLPELFNRLYYFKFGESPDQARSRDDRRKDQRLADFFYFKGRPQTLPPGKEWNTGEKITDWEAREIAVCDELVAAFRTEDLVAKYFDSGLVLAVSPSDPWNGDCAVAHLFISPVEAKDPGDRWSIYDGKILFVEERAFKAWLSKISGASVALHDPPRQRRKLKRDETDDEKNDRLSKALDYLKQHNDEWVRTDTESHRFSSREWRAFASDKNGPLQLKDRDAVWVWKTAKLTPSYRNVPGRK